MRKLLPMIALLFLCASSLSFGASYVQTDGTVIDPIQATDWEDHPYSGINLGPGVTLPAASLSEAVLTKANLIGADLTNITSMWGANLYLADLTGIYLQDIPS